MFLQTSVFTPSFGATTNVHINNKMTTQEVITQLLQKFKVGVITYYSIYKPLKDFMCLLSSLIISTLNFGRKNSLLTFSMQIENTPNEFALYCIHQSGGM